MSRSWLWSWAIGALIAVPLMLALAIVEDHSSPERAREAAAVARRRPTLRVPDVGPVRTAPRPYPK